MDIIPKQLRTAKLKRRGLLNAAIPKTSNVNKCAIEFENNSSSVFYSGQLICGNIHLRLDEKKDVRKVFVKVFGKAYVRWTESNNKNDTPYFGNENIFDERIDLIPESNDTIQLVPGAYKYTFKYKLPDDLPSSLEYKHGYIRYNVSAVLDCSVSYKEDFEKTFTVIGVSNLTPQMLEPVTIRDNETLHLFSCLCCPSELLETIVHIPHSGYLPHQTIDLHLHVNNRTITSVSELSVELIQEIQYVVHSMNPTKTTNTIVLKHEYLQGVAAREEKDVNVSILVPTVPPSRCSSIIRIKYFIKILVLTACCYSDPEIYLPIRIGSNPIKDNPTVPAWINPIANDFP